MAKFDIFISYRREGGYETAKHLYDLLTRDGYKVSFDIDTLRNGDFDRPLLNRINECKDFILIIDAHAFDRTLDPSFNPQNDWLRQELAHALRKGKNIIPIFLNGAVGFPVNLPNDIKDVSKKNGPEYNRYYFDAFYNKLVNKFLIATKHHNGRKFAFLLISLVTIIMIFFGYNILQPHYLSQNSEELKSFLTQFNSKNKMILSEQQFCDSILSIDSFLEFDSKGPEYIEGYLAYCLSDIIIHRFETDYYTKFRNHYVKDFIIRYIYLGMMNSTEAIDNMQLLNFTNDMMENLPGGYEIKFPLMNKDLDRIMDFIINSVRCGKKDTWTINIIKNRINNINKQVINQIEKLDDFNKVDSKLPLNNNKLDTILKMVNN